MESITSRLSGPRPFAVIGRWVLTPLDRMLAHSRLAPTRLATDLPLCFVTSIGRHSGEQRTAPLVFMPADEGGIVVVATNWGTERHPGWSYNLDSHPTARYEIDGTVTEAVARRATADEFGRYWPRFVERWPAYARYRARLHRDIRMYVLEPQPT